MPLVDSGHREVGERVLRVIVEAHHVCLILDGGVESGDANIVAGIAVGVVDVRRQCLDGLEVRHHGVPRPRGDERLVECRGLGDVGCVGVDPVASADEVAEVDLSGSRQEVLLVGLALRGYRPAVNLVVLGDDFPIVGERVAVVVKSREKTLPQKTFPPEFRISQPSGHRRLEAAERETSRGPGLRAADVGIVVVAVLVALGKGLGGSVPEIVVQIVLDHRRIGGEIPLGELVDVDIVVSAEQVVQNLVVLRAVPLVGESSVDCQELDRIPLGVDSKVEVVLVHTPLLDHVLRAVA